LFLVVIAFGMAFGAASVVDHLLWANEEATEVAALVFAI
jgi:hypothetical protein